MTNKNRNIFLIAIGILYIFVLYKYNIGIPCIFHKFTGFYCPGCGGNRAIISLMQLDFYKAIRYNLLITIFISVFFINCFFKYIFNKQIKYSNLFWDIILIITILFAILRNIPDLYFLAPI